MVSGIPKQDGRVRKAGYYKYVWRVRSVMCVYVRMLTQDVASSTLSSALIYLFLLLFAFLVGCCCCCFSALSWLFMQPTGLLHFVSDRLQLTWLHSDQNPPRTTPLRTTQQTAHQDEEPLVMESMNLLRVKIIILMRQWLLMECINFFYWCILVWKGCVWIGIQYCSVTRTLFIYIIVWF